ncbi:MAG: hypothetical protein V3V08_23845 [Nannocystaceae bacterium]
MGATSDIERLRLAVEDAIAKTLEALELDVSVTALDGPQSGQEVSVDPIYVLMPIGFRTSEVTLFLHASPRDCERLMHCVGGDSAGAYTYNDGDLRGGLAGLASMMAELMESVLGRNDISLGSPRVPEDPRALDRARHDCGGSIMLRASFGASEVYCDLLLDTIADDRKLAA